MDHPGRYITGTLGQQTRPKVIELHQLSIIQAHRQLLHEITLTIFEGETVALLGNSEQEKNALLACILGQIQPTRGTIHVLGASLPPLPVEVRRQLGVMPRLVDRKTHETVTACLYRFALYHGIHLSDEQLLRYCAHYKLSPETQVLELNQLQTRVLTLALALVHDPHLALLIEPLSDLNKAEQASLQTYLQQAQREGRTLLCTGTPPLDDKLFSGYDLKVRLEQGHLLREAW